MRTALFSIHRSQPHSAVPASDSRTAEHVTIAVVAALGLPVDAAAPLPYVLKLAGWNDFLSAPDTPLRDYLCIANALMKHPDVPIPFTLCPLPREDAQLVWGTTSRVRSACGDALPSLFDLAPLPPRQAPPPATVSDPAPVTEAPLDAMRIPFRVRPWAVDNLSTRTALDCTQLQLRFTVVCAGAEIDDASVHTDRLGLAPSRVPSADSSGDSASCVLWHDDFLSLGAELASLPSVRVASLLALRSCCSWCTHNLPIMRRPRG